jgi:dTDP-4-amino-4,6-dideoxygalactose transaminase
MGSYTVPFVDIPTHFKNYGEAYMTAVREVLSRGDLILREHVKRFEKGIADVVGTKFAVGLNSGFDALHLSVRAAGIKEGDEVITVAHTFVATVAAFVHVGAKPVIIDIGRDYNMDCSQLEKAVTKKTRAIIPVHLNGRMCDMHKVMEVAHKNNLIVIEDAAQALGSTFKGRKAGSFGLTGCFSLYPFKLLGAYGDAGIVTTNDEKIADKITWLRDHGQDRKTRDVRCYGFNARLDNLQAALLEIKLRHLNEWLDRRRAIAEMYRKGLSDIKALKLPHFDDDKYRDVYQNYVVRAERRDELAKFLEENGVEIMISWSKAMHHHDD